MSRKQPSPRKARRALLALSVEKARYDMRARRRVENAAEAALALRKSTPDWVDLKQQAIKLELEAEMDAMEARVDEGKLAIPILDMSRMPAFNKRTAVGPEDETLSPQDIAYANIKHPTLPKGETYAHPGYDDHRHPADDWRNYE